MALSDREKYILYNTLLVQAGLNRGESREKTKMLIDEMVKIKIPNLTKQEIQGIIEEIKDEVDDSITKLIKEEKKEKTKPKFFNWEN